MFLRVGCDTTSRIVFMVKAWLMMKQDPSAPSARKDAPVAKACELQANPQFLARQWYVFFTRAPGNTMLIICEVYYNSLCISRLLRRWPLLGLHNRTHTSRSFTLDRAAPLSLWGNQFHFHCQKMSVIFLLS